MKNLALGYLSRIGEIGQVFEKQAGAQHRKVLKNAP